MDLSARPMHLMLQVTWASGYNLNRNVFNACHVAAVLTVLTEQQLTFFSKCVRHKHI